MWQARSAFRGEDLLEEGTTSIADFAQDQTPGLQFNAGLQHRYARYPRHQHRRRFRSGGRHHRRWRAGLAQARASNRAARELLDLDPIDLERVEVPQGPQGTVYGANSLAGAHLVRLREPDLQAPTAIVRAGLSGTEDGGTSHSSSARRSAFRLSPIGWRCVSGFHDRAPASSTIVSPMPPIRMTLA